MKLKGKLILYYLLATLLTLFFVGYAVLNGIEALSVSTIEQQLIDQSNLAEIYMTQIHALEGETPERISKQTADTVISKLGLVIGNVHIYDHNLSLLASSKSDTMSITERENIKVLNAALKGDFAYIIKSDTVYFASPVNSEEYTIGILEIIYPLSFLINLLSSVAKILFIGVIVFAILLTLLSITISGKFTKPINQLAAAAKNYANRNFTPVEITSSDEIAQLSKSFNAMGAELQDYIQRQKQFVSNVSHELKTLLPQ